MIFFVLVGWGDFGDFGDIGDGIASPPLADPAFGRHGAMTVPFDLK
tara:strand:+ start:884 stop:1021 length:138 start_codon:yes stop_codon:yes gene_type:complete